MTIPFWSSHLASPGDIEINQLIKHRNILSDGINLKGVVDKGLPPEMKVSKIICAPLKKSPNWASHMGRSFGWAMLIPYSKPRTASSDSGLLHTWTHKDNTTHETEQFTLMFFTCYVRIFTSRKPVCSGLMWLRGMYMSLVSWHTTMACRWLNVPLPTSCPLMRILKPVTRYSNLNIDVTLKETTGNFQFLLILATPFGPTVVNIACVWTADNGCICFGWIAMR